VKNGYFSAKPELASFTSDSIFHQSLIRGYSQKKSLHIFLDTVPPGLPVYLVPIYISTGTENARVRVSQLNHWAVCYTNCSEYQTQHIGW